ncbi:hypothetical protein CBR_g57009 [Chara braunii]|uniref:Uncharacterized protein n=1 Tax=Chara braunii TaxID=69332 RepID=A0A388MDX7_CHABU|nr:hypothetical protein CBR_g57009 [Chara braunii]|eukprot:GBG92766.1 hypothetical protein CBR_g57009 [Chara braunii]
MSVQLRPYSGARTILPSCGFRGLKLTKQPNHKNRRHKDLKLSRQGQGRGKARGNGGRGGVESGNVSEILMEEEMGNGTLQGVREAKKMNKDMAEEEDWRNAICRHCAQKWHMISTNIDGDVYDKFGDYIDLTILGGMRKEAILRANGSNASAPPTMFRIWQEEDTLPRIRIEGLGENEVEQKMRADAVRRAIVVESNNEEQEDYRIEAGRTLERMEDLVAKIKDIKDSCTIYVKRLRSGKGRGRWLDTSDNHDKREERGWANGSSSESD